MNRDNIVAEIQRLKKAIDKTDSEYLKRDYGKALRRMEKQLRRERVRDWQTKQIEKEIHSI